MSMVQLGILEMATCNRASLGGLVVGDLPSLGVSFHDLLVPTAITTLVILLLGLAVVSASNRQSDRTLRRSRLSLLFYVLFIGLIVVLAGSSMGSIIRYGHMSGYALLVHIGAAGAFTFSLFVIALLYLPRGVLADSTRTAADNRWWFARWSAWALILTSLTAAGTMFLNMLPLLDTREMLQIAEVHRFAGLGVVLAAIAHAFALLTVRLGLR